MKVGRFLIDMQRLQSFSARKRMSRGARKPVRLVGSSIGSFIQKCGAPGTTTGADEKAGLLERQQEGLVMQLRRHQVVLGAGDQQARRCCCWRRWRS